MSKKVGILETVRMATEHIFNYISEVDSKTRYWANDKMKIESTELATMLQEEMPVEVSVVDELYDLIEEQENWINGGGGDGGTEETV